MQKASIFSMNTTKQLQYCYEDQTVVLDEMHTNKAQDHIGSDDGDEEILSLCDLPINCNKSQTSHHDHQDKQFNSNKTDQPHDHQQSPSSENQENIFEFFSEEWNIKSTTNSTSPTITISSPVTPPPHQAADYENIIFQSNSKTLNPETKIIVPKNITRPKRSNSSRMTHRKPNHTTSFTKSKSYSSGTSTEAYNNNGNFVSPAAKSKLLLVLFGLPPKMPTGQAEIMSDIKIRQSRHAPSTFFPTTSGCADDEAVQVGRRRSENRMWRFIKAATCFGSQRREKMSLSD